MQKTFSVKEARLAIEDVAQKSSRASDVLRAKALFIYSSATGLLTFVATHHFVPSNAFAKYFILLCLSILLIYVIFLSEFLIFVETARFDLHGASRTPASDMQQSLDKTFPFIINLGRRVLIDKIGFSLFVAAFLNILIPILKQVTLTK